MRIVLLLLVLALTLQAQSFRHVKLTGGFKIGAPINEPAGSNTLYYHYTQSRWTGGPTIELHLSKNLSIEFDSLFRNDRTNGSYPLRLDAVVNPYLFNSWQKTNVWDLPLLLKYRIPLRAFKPFVSGGYQWSHQSVEGTGLYQCLGPQGSCLPKDATFPDPINEWSFKTSNVKRSLAAGVGLEFKTRFITISPEVRFTRPVNDYPRNVRMTGLVGFTFGKR